MTADTTARTPREVAELVRRMVAGEDVKFSELFAPDGVLEYPFAPPGMPTRLEGREQIRAFHDTRVPGRRELIDIQEADLVVHETTDPEVVVLEITHRGHAKALDGPYEFTALGIVRVRDGEIVSYRDYMNPIAMTQLLGRTDDLVAALR